MAESKWNSADKNANITLSNGDRTATGASTAHKSVRSTDSKTGGDGKYYFEVVLSGGGAASDYLVGIMEGSHTLNSFVGNGAAGWGVQNGATWTNNSSSGGPTIGNTDVIMVAVSIVSGTVYIWFGVNNTWYNSGDPGAGTNYQYTFAYANPLFAAASPYSTGAAITARFRAAQQSYSLPSGFSAWDTNPAEESISDTGAITMTPTTQLGAYGGHSETGDISLTLSSQANFVASHAETGAITLTLAGQVDFYPVAADSTGDITLTVVVTKLVDADMDSTAAITMTLTPTVTMLASIAESAHIANWLAQAAELYDVWAMTLDDSGEGKAYPAYPWSNFNFNSFARLNGKTYAAGEGGLFVLGDYADNGTAINASLTTAESMLGTERDKRVTHAYVVGSFENAQKVDVQIGGDTYQYEAVTDSDGRRRRMKVKFGRGAKGDFWQFTIRNKNGGDIDVSDLMAAVNVLKRRKP